MKKDLETNELDRNMVYDRTLWRHLIHVAIPIPLGGIRLGGGGGCCIVLPPALFISKSCFLGSFNF
jgi:hypothetical protein